MWPSSERSPRPKGTSVRTLVAVLPRDRTVFHVDRIRVPRSPETHPRIARGNAAGQDRNPRSERILACPMEAGPEGIHRENPRGNSAGPHVSGTRVRGRSGAVGGADPAGGQPRSTIFVGDGGPHDRPHAADVRTLAQSHVAPGRSTLLAADVPAGVRSGSRETHVVSIQDEAIPTTPGSPTRTPAVIESPRR
jgi:hypothetical protein